MFVTVDRH